MAAVSDIPGSLSLRTSGVFFTRTTKNLTFWDVLLETCRNKGFTVQPSPSPSSILSSPSSKVGAHSEGQVKIYELLDPLELEKWQLQISNKIAMQTKEFGYDPKDNGILACQWNVQDLIYSFLCIDEDMKLYISKWNAG
ncbi:Uncharacterized protein Fot_19484 [Forsythia ovata]|uniref:Uncharacterized protein n=1 Tax=Forsythia ovata TaxID=205694 RepID=A0ABD1VL98_9LAMI